MYSTEVWKVTAAGAGGVTAEAGEFGVCFFIRPLALGESNPTYAIDNAQRAITCVNAFAGVSDPERELRNLRADSEYLSKYREAYTALVSREHALRSVVRLLAEEVRTTRAIVSLGDAGDLRLHTNLPSPNESQIRERDLRAARQRVDSESALEAAAAAPAPVANPDTLHGWDAESVQQIVNAARRVLGAHGFTPGDGSALAQLSLAVNGEWSALDVETKR